MLRLLLWAFFMSELLAPAGNPQALIGALNAGADAVYLAADRFGARAYADNFTEEEIIEGLKMAHLLHKKIYLTVNILTRQEELSELIAMVSRLYEASSCRTSGSLQPSTKPARNFFCMQAPRCPSRHRKRCRF